MCANDTTLEKWKKKMILFWENNAQGNHSQEDLAKSGYRSKSK
jgi:hypothetical protein